MYDVKKTIVDVSVAWIQLNADRFLVRYDVKSVYLMEKKKLKER